MEAEKKNNNANNIHTMFIIKFRQYIQFPLVVGGNRGIRNYKDGPNNKHLP